MADRGFLMQQLKQLLMAQQAPFPESFPYGDSLQRAQLGLGQQPGGAGELLAGALGLQ